MTTRHEKSMEHWREFTKRRHMSLTDLAAWQVGFEDGETHALVWFTHPIKFRRWFTTRYFWRMVFEARRKHVA